MINKLNLVDALYVKIGKIIKNNFILFFLFNFFCFFAFWVSLIFLLFFVVFPFFFLIFGKHSSVLK